MGSFSLRAKMFKQEKQANTATSTATSERVTYHATENYLNDNLTDDRCVEFHVSKPTALNAVVALEENSKLNKI